MTTLSIKINIPNSSCKWIQFKFIPSNLKISVPSMPEMLSIARRKCGSPLAFSLWLSNYNVIALFYYTCKAQLKPLCYFWKIFWYLTWNLQWLNKFLSQYCRKARVYQHIFISWWIFGSSTTHKKSKNNIIQTLLSIFIYHIRAKLTFYRRSIWKLMNEASCLASQNKPEKTK